MAHVAPWKKERVQELTELLTGNEVVGVVRVDGIPSAQIQQMRAALRGKVRFLVSKNNLLRLYPILFSSLPSVVSVSYLLTDLF